MRFALTVLASERSWQLPQAEVDKIVGEHVKLVVDLKAAGKLINVYRLRPGREAKTIRVRNGRRVVEDVRSQVRKKRSVRSTSSNVIHKMKQWLGLTSLRFSIGSQSRSGDCGQTSTFLELNQCP
jgi:hypothetical protein